jgi:ElaB/YqjD/DUF883 family membrane-anchored ribosome-binding protein
MFAQAGLQMARSPKSLTDNIAAAGSAALRDTRSSIDAAMADVGERAEDALQRARDVGDKLADGFAEAVHERPLVTLALAVGVGFVLGTAWRR